MKVYNTRHLNNKQRFPIAIAAGVISAIVCAILFAFIETLLPVHFPLLYIVMAYGVSYAVKTYGRGVQPKFTVIGVASVLLSFLLGYIFIYIFTFGFNFSLLPAYLQSVLVSLAVIDIRGIIELLCIAYSLYVAYYNSRII